MPRAKGQRLMCHGYVPILRAIYDAKGAMTWVALAEQFFDGRRLSAQQALEEMLTLKLVHVAGWAPVKLAHRTMPTALYAYGSGENAPHPGYANGAQRAELRRRPRAELIALASAIEALQEDQHHGASLAEELGVGSKVARKLIAALHAAGFVHIADWHRRPDGGVQCALHSFGIDQKDKPRPKPIPTAEHWRRHNANRSARRRSMHALGMSKTTRRVQIQDLGFVHQVA